jgi:hypothetical protein
VAAGPEPGRRRIRVWWATWFTRRPGHVYRALVVHPDQWDPLNSGGARVYPGYVGKTQRHDPQTRWDEHVNGTVTDPPKPWADTITSWEALFSSTGVPGWVLGVLEWWHIKTQRPLYNQRMNTRNQRAVIPLDAWAQREHRDQYKIRT